MNKWLHGNSRPCPDCDGKGLVHAGDVIEYVSGREERLLRRCLTCDGDGRLPLLPAEVLASSCAGADHK